MRTNHINTLIDKGIVYVTSSLSAQNAGLTTILLVAIELILRLRWKNLKFRSDTHITALITAFMHEEVVLVLQCCKIIMSILQYLHCAG